MKIILAALLVFTLFRGYEGVRENKIADVILKFYNGTDSSQFVDVLLPNSMALLTTPEFNPSSPTVFYVHGYHGTVNDESVQTVIAAYLDTYPDSNIIIVDWSNMADGDYFANAVPNTKRVSAALAAEIKNLINGGLNLQGIHLVGFSLGGHIVGFAGRQLAGYNMKLKRITALDPAFPAYYPGIFMSHIMGSDADFVDVIHTDAGLLGAPVHTGTADFWPNGGSSIQPGCITQPNPTTPFISCSHFRAWRYWCESLRYPNAFPAVPYNSWLEFKIESHHQNKPINYMGINTDVTKSGDFYLQTNCASLYGKGIPGTVFQLF